MPPNNTAKAAMQEPATTTVTNASRTAGEPHGKRLLMAVARRAAKAAGAIQMAHFAQRNHYVTATFAHDLKIEVDQLCQTAICDIIRRQFSDHVVLSEECGLSGPTTGDYIWIIDPLAGTVNYFQGMPYFCCCVACYRLGTPIPDPCEHTSIRWLDTIVPVAGAVYAPAMDQMYCAAVGQGATCNGRLLCTPEVARLGDAVVGVSLGSRERTIRHMTELIAHLAQQVRIYGATGLDIVNVASGTASGLIQPRVQIWDFAAARIILEESGGTFQARADDEGGWQIIAAAKPIHNSLQTLMEIYLLSSKAPVQSPGEQQETGKP